MEFKIGQVKVVMNNGGISLIISTPTQEIMPNLIYKREGDRVLQLNLYIFERLGETNVAAQSVQTIST